LNKRGQRVDINNHLRPFIAVTTGCCLQSAIRNPQSEIE